MNRPTAPQNPAFPERDVYSVARLNREVQQLLQQGFATIWIEAELSNFSRPASGHWYFSLKDRDAQVRCAMFRQRNFAVRFKPEDGMQVLARARVGLYEPRGEFQLVVEHIEVAGVGALQRQFEQLRDKLLAEGLFAPERKRPLPAMPRCIGVVTSPSGAAIRDILHTLAKRFPAAPVVVYPSAVQGAAAVPELLAALDRAASRAECDVLIVARGGGSIEDLWAFNDERVARRLCSMPMPVVSGIGHEVDITIADFAADQRAPTPTGAAQLAAPDARQWFQAFAALDLRVRRAMQRSLRERTQLLKLWQTRLRRAHPGQRLLQHLQRLDELQTRLTRALQQTLSRGEARLQNLDLRLRAAVERRLANAQQRLALAARGLQAISPLATLDRGFAVVTDMASGQALTDVAQVKHGAEIEARLAKGRVRAKVTRIDHE